MAVVVLMKNGESHVLESKSNEYHELLLGSSVPPAARVSLASPYTPCASTSSSSTERPSSASSTTSPAVVFAYIPVCEFFCSCRVYQLSPVGNIAPQCRPCEATVPKHPTRYMHSSGLPMKKPRGGTAAIQLVDVRRVRGAELG
eukprot:6179680-Pleurochrysis_carterae.AAC.1